MATKRATPRSGNYCGAKGSCSFKPDAIVSNAWTVAQRRAIEIGLGGGFIAMAALEVVFGW